MAEQQARRYVLAQGGGPISNEARRYVLEIPGSPLSPNQRRRAHWTVQARDARLYRALTALHVRQVHQGPPLERVRVVATVVRARGVAMDPDGAVGRVKHIVDGLTVRGGGGLVVDDSEQHMELVVQQSKEDRRCVRLEITEVRDDEPQDT